MTSPTASPARNLPGKSRSRSPPPLPPAVMHPALAVLLRGRKAILFPIGELDRDRGAGAQVPPWPSSRDLKRRLDALEAECSAALDADPPPPNLPLAGIIEGAVAQLRDSIEALAGYEAVVDRATSRQGFATAVQAQLQAPTPPATATPPQNQSSKDTQRTQTGKRARVSDEVKEEVLIKAESPSQPPSKRARIKPAADIPRSDLGSVIDESVRPASAPPRSRGRRTLIKVEAEALPSPLELPKSGSASRQRREPVQAPSSDIPSSPLLKKSHAPIQTEEKTARAASPASSISVASVTSKGLPFPKEATDILNAWLEEHINAPYACDAEKADLAKRTGLTITQVALWLTNARRRKLRFRASTPPAPLNELPKALELPKSGTSEASVELTTPRIEVAEMLLSLEREVRLGSEEIRSPGSGSAKYESAKEEWDE